MFEIALVGNPNSGKSTLFNQLTGARQRIGNFPGTTVERKSGTYRHASLEASVTDLPGLYNLNDKRLASQLDEQLVHEFFEVEQPDLIINVLNASSLAQSLFLTTELRELNVPVIVVVNMVDVAERAGIQVDKKHLEQSLGCPVVLTVASKRKGLDDLHQQIADSLQIDSKDAIAPIDTSNTSSTKARFEVIDAMVNEAVEIGSRRSSISATIDKVVLNRWLAFPIFLSIMYLMFFFSINVGSAFIDFFDIAGQALFVDGPRLLLQEFALPPWLVAFLADGVGGGIQLVGTFIPVIAALFLALAVLEDSGYMGRVAFILDKLLTKIGLPGKAFVPLLVGFGCNIPAVMATRSLDTQNDRILTVLMAPYMSCGARLTVYALFAVAFFPDSGQNVVFLLYLIGLLAAIGTAWIVRHELLPQASTQTVLHLPSYHVPTVRSVLLQTWHRLEGFIKRAGKAIVLVVIVLNVVNSIGRDGSIGNENTENSVLSAIGQSITPVFAPMGIHEDNWPATVGIFTGIFAKEVVVGTLDALYSQAAKTTQDYSLWNELKAAARSIPQNLGGLDDALADPLGIGIDSVDEIQAAAREQEVELSTVLAMQSLFNGQLGAFCYLLFILIYIPCVATIGVIYKELGSFWALFSTVWSIGLAYTVATVTYQIGTFSAAPLSSLTLITVVCSATAILFSALIWFGKRHTRFRSKLIATTHE